MALNGAGGGGGFPGGINLAGLQASSAAFLGLSAPSMVSNALLVPPASNAGVIHSPTGSQEEILSDEEARKRRELLARRPSYRKIFNDLSDVEGALKPEPEAGEGSDQTADADPNPATHPSLAGYNPPGLAGSLGGLNGGGEGGLGGLGGLMSGVVGGGGLSGYPDTSLLPVSCSGSDVLGLRPVGAGSPMPGPAGAYSPVNSSASSLKSLGGDCDNLGSGGHSSGPVSGSTGPSTQKRQLRLLKNREAAKECRRKKKEYVKCLENRVAVLENQNKALIEELKTLKELYCRKAD